MLEDEHKLLELLREQHDRELALVATTARLQMALEAARACSYGADVEAIVKVALPRAS